ncbi:DUF5677 domain-containing protein [Nocardioides jensenii]|uniref:DUF5677 domain-containing protein n=1 Tax=Nocardioides jensenii TaxID=1843 RepID=UPI000835C470|nr:DUF5677 domain-containing protein [Nocardioides jensenii]
MSPQDEYLACVDVACEGLDDVQEYGFAAGDAGGLLVLHGLAMYARDTARSASRLLRDSHTHAAAVLTRVVVEHAVLSQWLKVDPETRGGLFLQQSTVERARWFEVVLAANLDMTEAALSRIDPGARGGKPKNVAPEFNTVRNLFGDGESGRSLYLTYRSLSQFVHPSALTFARYTSNLPFGVNLATTLQTAQDSEALAFYLASAMVLCALPYFAVLGEDRAAVAVLIRAQASSVPTSLD